MHTSEASTERVLTALSMLGYRRWILRKKAYPSIPSRQSIEEKGLSKESEYQSITPICTPPVQTTATAPESSTTYIYPQAGVCITADGVLITDTDTPYAWFTPPLWRDKQHYRIWQSQCEQTLILSALNVVGLNELAALLQPHNDFTSAITTFPTGHVFPNALNLPKNINRIYTFSGWSCRALTGMVTIEHPNTIDWQDRQVQVICLPHPYRCLSHPEIKQQLWRLLIKLAHEI